MLRLPSPSLAVSALWALLATGALLACGCASPADPPPLAPANASDDDLAIRLAGDEAATALVRHLAQVFESRHPGVPVVVEAPLGAAGARAALADGLLDGALLAIPPGDADEGVLIARSAVVLAVGPGVRARRLTVDELVALALGAESRWPGGLQRQLVLRPPEDPVQRAFAAAVPALTAPLAEAVAARRWPVPRHEGALRDALRQPGAVAVSDRGNLLMHGSPTWEVALLDTATVRIELRLLPAASIPARLEAFVAFATGDEGRGLVADLGFEAPR